MKIKGSPLPDVISRSGDFLSVYGVVDVVSRGNKINIELKLSYKEMLKYCFSTSIRVWKIQYVSEKQFLN